MTTITAKQQQAIADLLATMTLPAGLGTEESACSIAAINLALSGQLTDAIPLCMSAVIGKWIIGVQDAMPAEMRNSAEWKRLLPLAAGTGRKHERKRMEIIMNWMWSTVLPTLQPIADRDGFGEEWRMMLQQRTAEAAKTASQAAVRASWADAADAADAAAVAADAADAARAAHAHVAAVAYAAAVAADAAAVAADAAADATSPDAWQQFNPCGLLKRLIAA